MSNRSDFKEPVKKALAKRAGNACSFPGCTAVTEGPSFETEVGISKTGMACHIFAAAAGPAARRVNLNITDEELTDISNGIWMCYTHGKLIDTDESTYTVEQLKTWKEVAEVRARLWQQFGRGIELSPEHFRSVPLPKSKVTFESLGQENHLIGEAISNSCVEQVWGREESQAIRDALIEIARNAFGHGNASKIEIEITENSITIIDNGSDYEAKKLLNEKRKGGGFHSIHEIMSSFDNRIFIASINNGKRNCHTFSVISSADEIRSLTPCYVEISRDYYWGNEESFTINEDCKSIHVIFPKYFALSDALKLPIMVKEHLPKGKDLTFVGENLSDRAVQIMNEELARAGLKDIKIINFNR